MSVYVRRARSPAGLWNAALLAHKCCYQFQLSERTQSVRSALDVDLAMHALDTASTQSYGTGLNNVSSVPVPPIYVPCFKYTPEQKANCGNQPPVGDLVANKTARGQFFYGIEITGQLRGTRTCVDFNEFLPVLPTFISIVWLSKYFSVEPIAMVETLQMVRELEPYIPAMPHVSLFRQSKERFDEFFALNFTNLLAIRGDRVDDDQAYSNCSQLIEHARRARGANISICVAGHPGGYLNPDQSVFNIDQNIEHLRGKIDSGANFIITQICYSPEQIVRYIRKVRDAGIVAPIMVGVVVPESFKVYETIEMISRVRLPPELRAEVEQYKDDDAKARNFFVKLTVRIIQHVLDADLGMHGIQFYTLNRMGSVRDVLKELRKLDILKDSPPEDTCDKA